MGNQNIFKSKSYFDQHIFGIKNCLAQNAVFPQGPIFSDFGPQSDFLEQIGPRKVRFCAQKSDFEGLSQHQLVHSAVLLPNRGTAECN